jgi:multiple sugar transport system substrate-binding protein
VSTLRIICWGHRRATDPLQAACISFRLQRPDVEIIIDVRPLSDFEHQGIAGVADQYDLVVFDHPFCGDIAAGGHFLPLEEAIPALLGSDSDGLYVGPSLDSYRYAGHVWGAPIDAATQNALYRADLLAALDETLPTTWHDAVALGRRLAPRKLFLGIAIETPHALATIASLMANAGRAWQTDPDEPLYIDRDAFLEAYSLVRELLAYSSPEALAWNSIDLHEAMVRRDDIVYCPAVYGYGTYAEADQRRRLSFAAFAGAATPFGTGSMIGGTALGISSHCAAAQDAVSFVTHILGATVQDHIIPEHHGQAARLSSWLDAENDRRFNGFFFATRESLEASWVRPRRPGYPVFQRDAGHAVAEALKTGRDGRAATDFILELAAQL